MQVSKPKLQKNSAGHFDEQSNSYFRSRLWILLPCLLLGAPLTVVALKVGPWWLSIYALLVLISLWFSADALLGSSNQENKNLEPDMSTMENPSRSNSIGGVESIELVKKTVKVSNRADTMFFNLPQKLNIGSTTTQFSMAAIARNQGDTIASQTRSITPNNPSKVTTVEFDPVRNQVFPVEAGRLYRRFFDDDFAGSFITDGEGKIRACNPAFIRIIGISNLDEALGTSVSQWLPMNDNDTPFLEMIQKVKKIANFETEMRRKDGCIVNVIANITGAFSAEGQLQEIRGFLMDITNRKKLEGRLVHSQKMEAVGLLAGGLAHDFNNLLTIISGCSELMSMRINDPNALTKYINQINGASSRAAVLIKQLLAFSRRQVLQPEIVDLNQLLKQMEVILQGMVAQGVLISFSMEEGIGRIKADPSQLEQALLNLTINAQEAMPEGGRLRFETHNIEFDTESAQIHGVPSPGFYVQILVSDTGKGMDSVTRTHLFEPFYTTKTKGKGRGLGLASVYGIITQSGGSISVYSEEGQGSTFKIYLPVLEYTTLPEKLQVLHANQSYKGNEKIILCEDEHGVRELAKSFLEKNGYSVIECHNGKEALAILENGDIHPDLLLTDVVMPEMDGRELGQKFNQLYPSAEILYMSGFNDEHFRQQGLSWNPSAFIQKPFSSEALLRRVQTGFRFKIEKPKR